MAVVETEVVIDAPTVRISDIPPGTVFTGTLVPLHLDRKSNLKGTFIRNYSLVYWLEEKDYFTFEKHTWLSTCNVKDCKVAKKMKITLEVE
jgi:hypothetical protein